MCVASGTEQAFQVCIRDLNLVVTCHAECPNLFLTNTVVDSWEIGIRRVSIQTFSHHIVEFKAIFVVIIRHWGSGTNNVLFFGSGMLETLKVISLVKNNIISIIQEGGVFLDARVEFLVWVVQVCFINNTMGQSVVTDLNMVVNLEGKILEVT